MDDYKVYVHIDPGGKRYYGATKLNVKDRWKRGRGYKNNKYFMKSIEKYGWDNIQHIIVAKGLTDEEAHWLEIELIKAYDTTNLSKGYNISKGGKGGFNGVKPSEDTRKKMSKAREGKRPNVKPVICITTNRVFCSSREGAEYYRMKSASGINRCCQGKHKYAGEYNGQKLVWRYLVWKHAKKFRKLVSFSSF